jgi:hypothetical protein
MRKGVEDPYSPRYCKQECVDDNATGRLGRPSMQKNCKSGDLPVKVFSFGGKV